MEGYYRSYVADEKWLAAYDEYQSKYKTTPRKSDADLAALVATIAREKSGPVRLLDVGCSTGNLLRHIRAATQGLPMTFVGADLAESSIAKAKSAPDLREMSFHLWDVTTLPDNEKFDIIVMSAVAFMLDDAEFTRALTSIHRALNPAGCFVAWELISELPNYRVEVEEWSPFYGGRSHPIQIRSFNMLERECRAIGFAGVEMHPFEPPELPKPDLSHYLSSYTIDVPGEGRRTARGCVIMPWGFLVATAP